MADITRGKSGKIRQASNSRHSSQENQNRFIQSGGRNSIRMISSTNQGNRQKNYQFSDEYSPVSRPTAPYNPLRPPVGITSANKPENPALVASSPSNEIETMRVNQLSSNESRYRERQGTACFKEELHLGDVRAKKGRDGDSKASVAG